MQNAFTTFASSRFVDREAVVATLRERAEWLKRCQAEVVAVYLFGFFATGSATPGISIGGVVGVSGAEKALRWEVWQVAFSSFPDAPVPVDVRVPLSAQLAQRVHAGRGVAGVAARRCSILVGADSARIIETVNYLPLLSERPALFGNGCASERIVSLIMEKAP